WWSQCNHTFAWYPTRGQADDPLPD
ncbi:hypothetical protein BN1723_020801, partial [Verticillium longisporum]